MSERIFAFIDSQNLNLGIQSSGWKLDFIKFITYLKTKYSVSETFLFIGYIRENTNLYLFLKNAGYRLVFKPTLEYKKGRKKVIKGNVDAELVLHTLIEWKKFDKAILVSGDGDFYCLHKYLEVKGKLHKILVPNDKYSLLLREFAPKIVPVTLLKTKLERK